MTTTDRRALLMVWDGLRPDYITPELTPALHRLAAEGARFADSHAVFPTVTRANSASIATGALPITHGIPGNSFYAPAIEPTKALGTNDAAALRRVAAGRGGRLLACDSLADRVERAGGRALVVSTGSPGSALLQHPHCDGSNGMVLNPGLWLGMEREALEQRIGPMPPGSLPNTEQNAWFTRAIADVLLPDLAPRLLSFWHTDPDRTQHDRGIGHPETLRALRDADDNLAVILAALDRLDLRGATDVIITSDHGFSSIIGAVDVAGALVAEGLKADRASTDIVVTGGAIYVSADARDRLDRIVALLQSMEGVGPIFRAGDIPEGDGTLPLDASGVGGPLAPDLLFSTDWRNDMNEYGYRGAAWAGSMEKVATHGCISPWDINNSLVAAGPSFKRGLVSDAPAGNIDIAPTLARTLGLPDDGAWDGRTLEEALVDGPDPASLPVERAILAAESSRVRYTQRIRVSSVGRARYLDYGEVER